jgi:hypothetical protein
MEASSRIATHHDCMTEGLNEALDLLERTARSPRRT